MLQKLEKVIKRGSVFIKSYIPWFGRMALQRDLYQKCKKGRGVRRTEIILKVAKGQW